MGYGLKHCKAITMGVIFSGCLRRKRLSSLQNKRSLGTSQSFLYLEAVRIYLLCFYHSDVVPIKQIQFSIHPEIHHISSWSFESANGQHCEWDLHLELSEAASSSWSLRQIDSQSHTSWVV